MAYKSQTEAAKILKVTKERITAIKKGADISLSEAVRLEAVTCYSVRDIHELGGWFCIKKGLSVKDGRTK